MSRIGKLPIPIPASVKVSIGEKEISVEGAKGKLVSPSFEGISCLEKEGQIVLTCEETSKVFRARHGLARALIANMIKGVSEGFTKKLEIIGVGYRVQLSGNVLNFTIGKSHPVLFTVPKELSVTVSDPTHFEISGADKQLVGQVAADIRSLATPEPYKGKGIRYEGEYVRRKAGKSVG
ncbi:50S ribosomal protein L6 [PVC group bacterium (ex Bugula neritina AB1)]|nr:50S ribosomal protein L6 [PVC group bacterium (ex Bugula neritina AB1)]